MLFVFFVLASETSRVFFILTNLLGFRYIEVSFFKISASAMSLCSTHKCFVASVRLLMKPFIEDLTVLNHTCAVIDGFLPHFQLKPDQSTVVVTCKIVTLGLQSLTIVFVGCFI
jgi:hypothetical protein